MLCPASPHSVSQRLSIRNAPSAGIRHHLDVLVQSALANLERVRFPLLTSLLQLFLGDAEFDGVLYCVNVDDVSVPYEGYGSTRLGLWRDVTDAEPVRPVRLRPASEQRGERG